MQSITKVMLFFFGALAFATPAISCAQTSCQSRELVVVELDFKNSNEIMKINNNLVKNGKGFDVFYKNCARKTAILVNAEVKMSKIFDVLLYMGKIGIKANRQSTFLFVTSTGSGSMVYMDTYSTIKYTNNESELLKIVNDPPQQSNWL